MRNKTLFYKWLFPFWIGWLFTACQHAAQVEQLPECEVTVNLFVEASGTRESDPGVGHDEHALLWEKLDLLFVYEKEQRVYKQTLSRKEYEQSASKQFLFTLPVGQVAVYAVAYGAAQESLSTATPDEVKNLRTNDLVEMAGEGVLDEERKKYLLGLFSGVITEPVELQSGKTQVFTLTLRRLVAKVDVQWDAQEAYAGQIYTDVTMGSMSINGLSRGYFFPHLHLEADNEPLAENVASHKMETPISKRNGRTYFYVFSGVKNQIRFDVTYQHATGEGATAPTTQTVNYIATFQQTLKQASWHKVNLSVKGNKFPQSGQNVEITLSQKTQADEQQNL